MKFAEVPVCQFVSSLNFSSVEKKLLVQKFQNLLPKGVIVNTSRELNDYVPGIYTRTKKDSNYRMIVNLKTFNKFLKFKHGKLESIKDAFDLVTEVVFFGSVDLKDAYYSIPIHENYQ